MSLFITLLVVLAMVLFYYGGITLIDTLVPTEFYIPCIIGLVAILVFVAWFGNYLTR